MKTSDFDYDLPQELIAQEPAAIRDRCRLLVMDRRSGACADRIFCDIGDYLRKGDLLVANGVFPRVFPTRLSHEAFPQGCPTCTRGGSRSSA